MSFLHPGGGKFTLPPTHIPNVYAEILREEATGNVIVHRYAEIDLNEQKLHANYTRDHPDEPHYAEYREFLSQHFSPLWD